MAVGATEQAALEQPILNWRWLCYLDFDGDELRATNNLYTKDVVGSGDAELDGEYFSIPTALVSIGPVAHSESGSETVTVELSGLVLNDSTLLAEIGDRTQWQGRIARLWWYLVDENEAQIGDYIGYYTGYMDSVSISGEPTSQKISLRIENYLSTLAGASNKTYMMQELFDSGDTSAAATIAAANGIVEGLISGGYGYGGGSSGGVFREKFDAADVIEY